METACNAQPATETDAVLTAVIERIERINANAGPGKTELPESQAARRESNGFVPIEPASFRAAGLTDSEVEALVLKFLLACGDAAGRDIAGQIKLPFVLVEQLLRDQ